tara:strand:+ start:1928 stop:3799 length:1872 start_codon:yes stop_codon:yes gene_type:complete
MVEVSKPDYISLVNKAGSGFNVKEIVTAIVDAEIVPRRVIQEQNKQQAEGAISGIGILNSQTLLTKGGLETIQSKVFHTSASTSSNSIDLTVTDDGRISTGAHNISNVVTAKKMVFELPGFTDLTSSISKRLTFNFGSWTQTSTAASSASNTVEAGKTYVTSSKTVSGDGTAFDEFTRDPNDTTDADEFLTANPIPVGAHFRSSADFTNSNYTFTEVDAYAFTAASDNTPATIALSGTLNNVVSQLNQVNGIGAKLVQTNSTGTATYSIVLESDDTGLNGGFKITEAGSDSRWETTQTPATNSSNNKFSQLSRDASLELNGVSVTRETNSITDLITGAKINLKKDIAADVNLTVSNSKSDIEQLVKDTLNHLTGFQQTLQDLTFVDTTGDNDGSLSSDFSVRRLKQQFKDVLFNPISGYGANDIYLSHLGIRVTKTGVLYFDQAAFDSTYQNNPSFFAALKDPSVSTDLPGATVTKSQYLNMDAGTYAVSDSSGSWKIGDKTLTRTANGSGSSFTSTTYPGLIIETIEASPADFNVFIGKSFVTKFTDFADSILSISSYISDAKLNYQARLIDISSRLDQISEREKLLTNRYKEQFTSMESVMFETNSTKSLLENLVAQWNKD